VAVSRCLASLTVLAGSAAGARVAKKRGQDAKFIAGVPVLNYDAAFGGEASLAELGAEEEWNIVVNKGVTDAQIQEMCKKAPYGCKQTGNPSKGGVPFFEMRGTEAELEAVIKSSPGSVKFAEPDTMVYAIPELTAENPESQLWGLERVAAYTRTSQGSGVTVFLTDTGVRASHQDFGGRVIPTLDLTSDSLVECNGDTSCAGDAQGHGTHCAGTAAGANYGVAPQATIRSVKVLSDQGSGSWSWSYSALNWMATSSIRPSVASMSLGGPGTQNAMKDAVDAATNSGVVVTVAGGNSNTDSCGFSPAFVPSAITVGSTDSRDDRSSFSNYGACTNIWAPGSSILSAGHRSDTATATFSGTSMACPHVAGGIMLVLEANPGFNYAKVLEKLHADASTDSVKGLRTGDINKMLYVGADAPPPAGEVPPPGEGDDCPSYCLLCLLPQCPSHCCSWSSAANATPQATIPLSVNDCGGSSHVARLSDYSPKSVQSGVENQLNAWGTISEDVTGGRLNLAASMTGFPWTGLGSVTNHDICTPKALELRALGIWGGTMVYEGLACPVRASAGSINLPIKLTLASILPGGMANTRTDINGTASNGKPLLCATVTTSR